MVVSGCVNSERPTGYSGNPSINGYVVETCDEDTFDGEWWSFHTSNAIANTIVPFYKDFCSLVTPEYLFFWNQEEGWGYYDYGYDWYCKNENTMTIVNTATGDEIEVLIYGQINEGCHKVKITYNSLSIRGEVCSCEYNGE